MTSPDDALTFSGFEKCASSREYYWHLAADREAQWDRFPDAQSWEWVPGKNCKGMEPLNPENLVKDLVEDGGWYLVGDSVTENHFFSLSCILYPHVIATPDYTSGGDFDRAWPQNLYLNPSSPLLSTLSLPLGFNITSTPLVTFRRIDLLLSKDELISIHTSSQPQNVSLNDTTLFSDERLWTLPIAEYLNEFLVPLPEANYATMVVSTAGHWTTTVFSKVEPPGINGVLNLFEVAMEKWAEEIQSTLQKHPRDEDAAYLSRFPLKSPMLKRKERRVVIRAYLPGHESCHDFRKPWDKIQPFQWNWYNWNEISQFNEIFEKLLLSRDRFPNIHYLGIDRPARLRPDAHATGDCLHIMTGAGVLEGWTHYIWQYISREIA
ncbi:hypothetical protein BYT27DRAFT_7215206 [Phlegmacium glaucopus]|nr:hypothetical protein BYT27DRAFT_7215206 [Phlegmacium glaucopus]